MQKMKKRLLSAATALIMGVTAFSSMGVSVAAVQEYDLYIGDVKVTSKNFYDILNNGVFKYSPYDNKLTISGDFTGQYIDYQSKKQAILSDLNNLTIEVEKDSNIYGTIRLNGDTTITGKGHLNVEYDDYWGTALRNSKTLKFVDADVSVKGNNEVCVGQTHSDNYPAENTIEIHHSRLDLKSTKNYAMCYKNIVLKDSYIENPVGGYTAAHYICTSESRAANEVLITPIDKYGIEIDKIPVTSINKSDIKGDGKVSYDSDTKTLTLNGGTYNYINNEEVEGLTINVADDTTVKNESESNNYGRAFELDKNTTITGKGNLTVDAVKGGIANWYDSTLTIEDADIDITANYALTGPSVDKAFEKLVIINSNLNLVGRNAAISNFNNGIVLKNCRIVDPENAFVSERGDVYESDKETYATTVKIKKIITGPKKGDISGDGKITISDVAKVAAHIKGKKILTEEQQAIADIDGNGKITISDLTRIAAYVKGKKLIK